MIEVKHLRLIDAIAKLGTLSKAADELCLTAPALSHQLKELESRLGIQIFHRVNNKLHFTDAGKEIRDSGHKLLEQFDELEHRLKSINRDQLRNYVHGYTSEEAERLNNQANTISDLLHWDSIWEEGSYVLEVGCGVGAQTKIIAAKNPHAHFMSIDLSDVSLRKAKQQAADSRIDNVTFQQADVFNLPFEDASFDHVFVCFLLEHLANPERALMELRRVLRPEGTITVIEGDHGSTYFHPDSEEAKNAIKAQVDLQRQKGGNANIGRELYPLLTSTGYKEVFVDPRLVYIDASKPQLMEGFIENTFTAMIQGIKEEAISNKMISKIVIDKGIKDLLKTTDKGTFCYTFFKAVAKVG